MGEPPDEITSTTFSLSLSEAGTPQEGNPSNLDGPPF